MLSCLEAVAVGMQGDSGFILVRDGQIVLQSEPLQHFFDCPFQFAAVPEHTNATDFAEVRSAIPSLSHSLWHSKPASAKGCDGPVAPVAAPCESS